MEGQKKQEAKEREKKRTTRILNTNEPRKLGNFVNLVFTEGRKDRHLGVKIRQDRYVDGELYQSRPDERPISAEVAVQNPQHIGQQHHDHGRPRQRQRGTASRRSVPKIEQLGQRLTRIDDRCRNRYTQFDPFPQSESCLGLHRDACTKP